MFSYKKSCYNFVETNKNRFTEYYKLFSEILTEMHEINTYTVCSQKGCLTLINFPFLTNVLCFKLRYKTQCIFFTFLRIVLTVFLMTNHNVMNWVMLPFVISLLFTSTLCYYYWWLLTLFYPIYVCFSSLFEVTLCKNTVWYLGTGPVISIKSLPKRQVLLVVLYQISHSTQGLCKVA